MGGMIDPQWRRLPGQPAYESDVLKAVLLDDGSFMVVNWAQQPRWFHMNRGIGNSLHMWWPSREGDHSVWVLCDRCGLPFSLPTGFHMEGSDGPRSPLKLQDVEWTGGPCPSCKEDGVIATGRPLLSVVSDNVGRSAIAGSNESALRAWDRWQELTEGLERGEISVQEAAGRLRSEGGPLSRVADWLENRPVTTMAAATILAAIINLTGGQLASWGQTPGETSDDDRIVEIIDTVLDHYDRAHPTPEDRRERQRNGLP